MFKNKKALITLFILISIFSLLAFLQLRYENEDQTLKFSGNIELTEVNISFQIPGIMTERKVSEGESIQVGDTVAILDTELLIQELELKQAELLGAKAELDELQDGYLKEEIAKAEAKFNETKANFENISTDFQRQKELFENKVISDREFDSSNSNYKMAQAKMQEAKEQWVLLKNGYRKEKIARGEANFLRAKKSLELSETKLGYAKITSPIAGIVLSENVESGEYVSAGTPIVTIGDLTKVWLRGYIDERDLGKIYLGQEVKVSIDSFPDKEYIGKIAFISSEAEFTPKTIQTEKERVKLVYRIKVNIPNPNQELKPGMPADGRIVIDLLRK